MTTYYNEIDPYAAQWLRNLIDAGLIAPGDVDERDIKDILPDDLDGYTQCHFFAGLGAWSYALRRAGWPDDRPVWTGSCPCQPFSAAGRRKGSSDERHLWPHFFHLIEVGAPAVVFGEQVASKDGLGWLDLVQTDLEGAGYAVGAGDLCAAGVGAPHIRQRLWWVAEGVDHTPSPRQQPSRQGPEAEAWDETRVRGSERGRGDVGMANTHERQCRRVADSEGCRPDRTQAGRVEGDGKFESSRATGGMALAAGEGLEGRPGRTVGDECATAERGGGSVGMADADRYGCGEAAVTGSDDKEHNFEPRGEFGWMADADEQTRGGRRIRGPEESIGARARPACERPAGFRENHRPRPTDGFWRDADWLHCRDGKWRPVEPGTFPLVDGAPARVGRLRAYGNAIVAEAAQVFIESYLDVKNAA